MKKIISVIAAIVLAAAALAGCAAEPTVKVTSLPSAALSVMPSASQGTSPSATVLSPTASPTDAPPPSSAPAIDIPDILKSKNETVVNSNYTLYEDGKYIYYLNQYVSDVYLFRIDKNNGNVVRISDKDCGCFTVSKGIVYYTEYSGSHDDWGLYNVIKSYNPLTNKKKTVKKLDYWIVSMAAYGSKLYFSYYPHNPEDDSDVSNLYVINTDGTGKKKVIENVETFSIYKGVIYYTGCDYPDGAPLRKCNLDGSDPEELLDWIDGYFDIGGNKLFYESGYIDLGTGKSTDMVYYLYAPFGQYLIYDDSKQTGTYYFHSYDFESGKTADLTQIREIDGFCSLHPTKENIYFSVANDDGSFDLYRLIIENGKASMKLTASYKIPAANAPAPTATAEPEPLPTSEPEPSI